MEFIIIIAQEKKNTYQLRFFLIAAQYKRNLMSTQRRPIDDNEPAIKCDSDFFPQFFFII